MVVSAKLETSIYVSASSVRLIQECPKAWLFKYFVGEPPEDVSARMILGSACHEAVAAFYVALRDGNPEPSVDDMVATATARIRVAAAGPVPLLFEGEQDLDGLIEEAARLLSAFAAQGHRPETVVAVEEPFSAPVGVHPGTGEVLGAEESIAGIFDLVAEDGDGVAIIDHKFRKRAEPEGTIELQMAIYAMVAREVFPSARSVTLFHQNIVSTKTVRVELRKLHHRDQDLAEAYEAIASGITLIHAAIGHPNPRRLLGRRRGWWCQTCSYRTRCATDRG